MSNKLRILVSKMGGKETKTLDYYRLDTDQVLKQLGTNSGGLGPDEVKHRLVKHGYNRLEQLHRESALRKYLRQYKDMMALLLLASSSISFILDDSRTGIALLILVILNSFIGFSQEYKAEKLMASLERLVVSEAKVVRGGEVEQVASAELVTGDIVYIEEGDSVPADLRLISESELASNDFALTGESEPTRKFTHAIESSVELANRHNLVFMGTTIATGNGYGVVIGTGMQTELGRIASLSSDLPSDLSPLQREMKHVAIRVSQGTVLLCAIFLPLAINADLPFREALVFAIGFACSLIPNGLPAAINTSLARAANKLGHAKALVKKLSAVETLGATTIILTDKTGTLTKNEMTAVQFMVGKTVYMVDGTGYQSNGKILEDGKAVSKKTLQDLNLFFSAGALASNARVSPPNEEHPDWYVVGDPTEGALITLARKAGIDIDELETAHPELSEFTFDSARKRMSSFRTFGSHRQLFVFVKGAPESVLERCDDIWDHGHIRKLSVKDRNFIGENNASFAQQALRNIGFAFRVLPAGTDPKSLSMEEAEKNLTWLGLASMIDPLRDEVPMAMQEAKLAQIKVSIITGDFATTAQAVALRAGLIATPSEAVVVSGEELRTLNDSKLSKLIDRGSVIFSRVSPEDKLRIVNLAKANGEVVAVTGDGINDAPALKRADIGVAMGRTGTDVAKQSAEIVLLDDSFQTLVNATQQGRVIFQNIKKSALSVFAANASELAVNMFSLAATVMFGIPLALTVMLILAVDLIAELFPIAALGWDQAENEIMREQPRRLDDHILNAKSVTALFWSGLIIGGLAFGNYVWYFYRHGVDPQAVMSGSPLHHKAMAITYLTLVLCLFINILYQRTKKGLFTRYQLHNKPLGIAFATSMFLVINVIYNPILWPYFGTGPLGLLDWVYTMGIVAIFIAIKEVESYAARHHTREHVLELLQQNQ